MIPRSELLYCKVCGRVSGGCGPQKAREIGGTYLRHDILLRDKQLSRKEPDGGYYMSASVSAGHWESLKIEHDIRTQFQRGSAAGRQSGAWI